MGKFKKQTDLDYIVQYLTLLVLIMLIYHFKLWSDFEQIFKAISNYISNLFL